VKDLFDARFASILAQYPLVQAAAADIRRVTGGYPETAVPLERFLREQMQNSESPYTQRRFRQVPLYLQHVLEYTSNTKGGGYTEEPDNYNGLVNALLELDEVLFLTLNYDTLLDDRLFLYVPLEDLDSYVASDPRWALVKLHGSVNWGRRLEIQLDREYATTPDAATLIIDRLDELRFVSDELELRLHGDVGRRRFDGSGDVFYPAVSVPLGEEDEVVCPSSHVDVARQRLSREDGINLLVIGYSGVDREVLGLFRESGNTIRNLLVANGDSQASFSAAEKICGAFGDSGVREDSIFSGGFTDLVTSGRLHRWIESL
jgi:hypothetical protein